MDPTEGVFHCYWLKFYRAPSLLESPKHSKSSNRKCRNAVMTCVKLASTLLLTG